MIDIPIIYQDEDLVIINKPAGIVSNRAESVEGETLQDFMQLHYPDNFLDKNPDSQEFVNRTGLLHRLDKETSGVMVLAKNAKTFSFIKQQFMQRKTKKWYVALVHGKVQPKWGTVNLPIKRNMLNRRRFTVKVEGKMARTIYSLQENYTYQGQDFSLLSLQLLTGRTHQIRVHMSYLGYPLMSDPLYLGKRLENDLKLCPRLFLHAQKLRFIHPKSLREVEFTADLADDLQKVIQNIKNSSK